MTYLSRLADQQKMNEHNSDSKINFLSHFTKHKCQSFAGFSFYNVRICSVSILYHCKLKTANPRIDISHILLLPDWFVFLFINQLSPPYH